MFEYFEEVGKINIDQLDGDLEQIIEELENEFDVDLTISNGFIVKYEPGKGNDYV